jgi:hypothetical protein
MISKQMKNQFKVWGVIVLIFYVVCFAFLVVHNFQVWTLFPFVESIIGVFMSAGAIAIITGIILVFQSSIQSEQEKKKIVFDKKLSLYMKIIDDLNRYFEDDIIDEKEKRDLFFTLLKVEILSKPATFNEFANLIQNLADDNGVINEESSKNLVQFISLAREDLDVQEKITDASEKKLFDDALKVTETEGEKSASGYGSRFSIEKGKYSESELSELLSNYFSDKDCKNEKQRRKKYKLNTFFNVLLSEDRLFQREEIKEILIKENTWVHHFEEDWGHRDYTSNSGQVKTYGWYVGNYMSNISKDFSRPNNDYLRQILSFESHGWDAGDFEIKAGAAGSIKDSYYIEKKYRPLIQKILNN